MASGKIFGAAHVLREQNGSHGRRFFRCVEMIKSPWRHSAGLQLPIGAEAEYEGLVDLVRMKEVVWKDEALGAEYVMLIFATR